MRPIKANIAAVGATPWIRLSYLQPTFNVTLTAIPSSNIAGANWAIQYTVDDQSTSRPVGIVQTASTTATITDPGHMLSVGDSVTVRGTDPGAKNIDGTYAVQTIVDQNSYTITTALNQTATFTSAQVTPARVLLITGGAGTNLRVTQVVGPGPVQAVRLAVSAIGTGSVDFLVLQGVGG